MIRGVHTMFYSSEPEAFRALVRDKLRGYGLVTHFNMPGGVTVQLYQPRYVKRPANA